MVVTFENGLDAFLEVFSCVFAWDLSNWSRMSYCGTIARLPRSRWAFYVSLLEHVKDAPLGISHSIDVFDDDSILFFAEVNDFFDLILEFYLFVLVDTIACSSLAFSTVRSHIVR